MDKEMYLEFKEEMKTIIEHQNDMISSKFDYIMLDISNIKSDISNIKTEMKSFNDYKNNHYFVCPNTSKIEKAELELNGYQKVGKFIIKGVTIVGVVFGIIFGIWGILKK